MAAKTIISRPIYGTLSPQPGKHHLFIADAEGALAIIDVAGKAPAGFFDGAEIVFIPGPDGKHIGVLEALKPAQFHLAPSCHG